MSSAEGVTGGGASHAVSSAEGVTGGGASHAASSAEGVTGGGKRGPVLSVAKLLAGLVLVLITVAASSDCRSGEYRYIDRARVLVRPCPSTTDEKCKPITYLAINAEVRLVGPEEDKSADTTSKPGWEKVEYEGGTGFVAARYLRSKPYEEQELRAKLEEAFEKHTNIDVWLQALAELRKLSPPMASVLVNYYGDLYAVQRFAFVRASSGQPWQDPLEVQDPGDWIQTGARACAPAVKKLKGAPRLTLWRRWLTDTGDFGGFLALYYETDATAVHHCVGRWREIDGVNQVEYLELFDNIDAPGTILDAFERAPESVRLRDMPVLAH